MSQSFSAYNRYSLLDSICAECNSRNCLCLDSYSKSSIILTNDTDSHSNIHLSVSYNRNFVNLSKHAVSSHSSHFQRPSDGVDYVLYHDNETSLHDNTLSQHHHSNQSYDKSLTLCTISDENLQSSTQESQQESDSQETVHDTILSSTKTSINYSLPVEEGSQQVSVGSTNDHGQCVSNNVFNIGYRDKGFRIGHLNIQGIRNKVEQLKLLLQSEQNLIHIFGLSETKLSEVHPDASFEISGYQKPFRRDRKENTGGGLLVYIKEGVSCSRRTDLEHERVECIWVEIKPINSKSFLVGHIYRPPNSTVQWSEFF